MIANAIPIMAAIGNMIIVAVIDAGIVILVVYQSLVLALLAEHKEM